LPTVDRCGHTEHYSEWRIVKTNLTRFCLFFKQRAVTQLDGIFGQYKPNVIRIASQLARTLRFK